MKNKLFKPILLSIMALSLIGCESNNTADKNLGENQVVEAHDEDIYYANLLIDQYKKKGPIDDKFYIDAAIPQVRLNTLASKALEILAFYLEHGKASTLADGEIANEMLYNAMKATVPTIKANLEGVSYKYDLDQALKEAYKLYQNNRNIIERRKAWQEYI